MAANLTLAADLLRAGAGLMLALYLVRMLVIVRRARA